MSLKNTPGDVFFSTSEEFNTEIGNIEETLLSKEVIIVHPPVIANITPDQELNLNVESENGNAISQNIKQQPIRKRDGLSFHSPTVRFNFPEAIAFNGVSDRITLAILLIIASILFLIITIGFGLTNPSISIGILVLLIVAMVLPLISIIICEKGKTIFPENTSFEVIQIISVILLIPSFILLVLAISA